MKTEIPTFDQLFEPVVKALRDLGGSGSIAEITARVVENLKLGSEVTEVLHNPETDSRTELEYRMAWARTYLKKFGILENSARGVWALKKGRESEKIDAKKIVRYVNELSRPSRAAAKPSNGGEAVASSEDEEDLGLWQSRLHAILTKKLDPKAFERLIQRLLRESGFIQVEVTGRSGDGGIDGKGIARLHGFMSFHVVFQAKRYQGTISAAQIRDFRGAMVGRADKGLFITTGTFSRDALREATRDGAPPIDLVDGDQLAEKLKEFRLGVTTELIEKVTIDETWFTSV
jgi:restriction system protein